MGQESVDLENRPQETVTTTGALSLLSLEPGACSPSPLKPLDLSYLSPLVFLPLSPPKGQERRRGELDVMGV